MKTNGYVIGAVGAVLGAAVLGVGLAIAASLLSGFVVEEPLAQLFVGWVVGFYGGLWIGTSLGSWAALRILKFEAAAKTAAGAAVLVPPLFAASYFLPGADVNGWAWLALHSAIVSLAAVFGRYLAQRVRPAAPPFGPI